MDCEFGNLIRPPSVQAAPVTVTREILQRTSGNRINAVVINSGCANAVTGKHGIDDAIAMSKMVDACLPYTRSPKTSNGEGSTLVMSTGVIGQRLPIAKILAGESLQRYKIESQRASGLFSALQDVLVHFRACRLFHEKQALGPRRETTA
jgi:N-acetylglutamate synthase/N-acetylornithine aminotransferase